MALNNARAALVVIDGHCPPRHVIKWIEQLIRYKQTYNNGSNSNSPATKKQQGQGQEDDVADSGGGCGGSSSIVVVVVVVVVAIIFSSLFRIGIPAQSRSSSSGTPPLRYYADYIYNIAICDSVIIIHPIELSSGK